MSPFKLNAEVLDRPPELVDRLRVNALVDSVSSTEEQVSKTRVTLGKLQRVLLSFHEAMFPQYLKPKDIDTLVGAFLGMNALVDFSRAQTISGAEAVLTLSQAQGIQGDFVAAFRGVPLDSSGAEVDLKPFEKSASILANQLLAMLQARAEAAEEEDDVWG